MIADVAAISIACAPRRSASARRDRNRQREEQHADHLQQQEVPRA